jgi:hypothetical protein
MSASSFGSFLLGTASLLALASPALADGREPGSVLVYPYQRSALQLESPDQEGAEGLAGVPVFNVVSVTNTNRQGAGSTDVHFEYVNVGASISPFLFANCTIADRVETLTPADTLSVLTSCHNSASFAEGYLVVSAMDPSQIDTYWSFNHLIGSSQIISAMGGMYALNAIPFTAEGLEGDNTDLNNNGARDFDGIEYERVADELYIDSFIGTIPGELILISLTGGNYLTNVKFIIFNDDEFQLSGEYWFACWTRTPLNEISGFFTQLGLKTTVTDARELDTNCDGVGETETGWAIVRPMTSLSITSANITNPAVLGALTNDVAPWMNARLLWESVAKQDNGRFPAAD